MKRGNVGALNAPYLIDSVVSYPSMNRRINIYTLRENFGEAATENSPTFIQTSTSYL